MCYGVDGKAGEGGDRLGAIGRDHLGELGHYLRRDDQLRHDGARRAAEGVWFAHDENQPSA